MSDYIKPDFEESIPVEVWLWLLIVMGPYNPKTMLILSMYDYDVTEAAKAVRDGKIEFLSDDETSRAKETRNSSIYEIMSLCKKNNVKIVTLDSKDYPKLLRNIENPPVVLFCAGDLSGLDKALTVSAVGTRDASEYSYNVTKTLISPLVKLHDLYLTFLLDMHILHYLPIQVELVPFYIQQPLLLHLHLIF